MTFSANEKVGNIEGNIDVAEETLVDECVVEENAASNYRLLNMLV